MKPVFPLYMNPPTSSFPFNHAELANTYLVPLPIVFNSSISVIKERIHPFRIVVQAIRVPFFITYMNVP